MDSETQIYAPGSKPNKFTNCQSSRPNSGGMDFGTGYLFWSSETRFDSKQIFEELSRSFMDCDVNCNICVNFVSALNQHIRTAHGQPLKTDTGGQSASKNSETEGQGSSLTTVSNEAEVDEMPRTLNTNEKKIVIVDLEEETPPELPLSHPNKTTISDEDKMTQNQSIPMDETVSVTVTELPQVPNERQLIRCGFCQDKFVYRKLKAHAESCHPELLVDIKNYHCRVCGLDTTFMSGAAARQHLYESHPGEKPLLCKFCNKPISSYSNHMKRCSSRKHLRFQCVICESCFATAGGLNRHVNDCHSEKRAKLVLNCHICGGNFGSDKQLTEHKQKTHLSSSSAVNDPKPKKTIIKTEMQTRKKEKRFECSTCEKRFSKSENLFRHLEKKHKENVEQEQEQESFCGVCDIKFRTARKLLSHRQKVHPEPEPEVQNSKVPKQSIPKMNKRYTCQLCNEKYSIRLKYKQHLRTHRTSEFPNGKRS